MLCPIAWQLCYTLVNLGISFNFLCSKKVLSFPSGNFTQLHCYPCDKEQCSVPPEEDLVLSYWQGRGSEGPCVPYKRCWCSRQNLMLVLWKCFIHLVPVRSLCVLGSLWKISLVTVKSRKVISGESKAGHHRTLPNTACCVWKCTQYTDCVTELASGDSCGLQQVI